MQNNIPIYTQLETLIKEKIKCGEYRQGEAIPSERKLAEAYGINRMTVRAAITNLQKDGIIIKIQGKGNFVSGPRRVKNLIAFKGFTAMLKERGIAHKSRLLMAKKVQAGYQLAKIFSVQKGEALYRIIRLRLGNDQPLAIEDTHIPCDLFDGVETVDYETVSLFDTMEAHGIHVVRSRQIMTSYFISGTPAELLGLANDTPVYRVTYQTYDTTGRLVEYTTALINPEKSTITTDLR